MKKIISAIICLSMIIAVTVTALAIVGDINEDGEADNKDVVVLFRYVSGTDKLEDESVYDFNGDGDVDNKDVVALFRYLSGGEIVTEPESESEPETESDAEPETESDIEPETESESEPETESESESETEKEKPVLDDSYYVYDSANDDPMIYVKIPEGYTAYDSYQGFPSIVCDDAPDGRCFYNFMFQDVSDVMTDESATRFLEAMKGTIGNYTKDNFESYEVDGIPVTKLDFTWGNKIQGHVVKQSLVKVYFDYGTVVIQLAFWDDVPGGMEAFNYSISYLGICEEALED